MDILTVKTYKDRVAQLKGYSNWKEYYDWIAREGQKPEVVAQLIESAMEEAYKQGLLELKDILHNIIIFD